MPCTYIETPEELARAKKAEVIKDPEYMRIRKELDRVTSLLCEVMKDLDTKTGYIFYQVRRNGDLDNWWTEHKKMDEIQRNEVLKEKALAKLTAKEKEVLGLK